MERGIRMPTLSCNSCNAEFADDVEQKLHYKSEWHRYNLKRKIAGVPGVTEALFSARQTALEEEKNSSNESPMLYSCGLCGKGYRSVKAHAQHIQSKSHVLRASQGTAAGDSDAIIKPLPPRVFDKLPRENRQDTEESEDSEWEEVDPEDLLDVGENMDEDDEHENDDRMLEDFDPSCCFMCDLQNDSIESCIVHMHKWHGFFIPDVEYLKDPKGLLTFLGLKVKRDLMCLYCNDRCYPFTSLEAVRKHMDAKGHCKVHYGDDDDEEEAELEEFYDYSSSYVDADGKQLVAADDQENRIAFGTGGSEIIITRNSEGGSTSRVLGSREFLRYYRQKPKPMAINGIPLSAALASRYRSMGLATVQSKESMVRLKVLKAMNKTGVEAMRSKMGMKSNVIRNLPKNCTY